MVADFCHLVVSLFRGRNNEITIIIVLSPSLFSGRNNEDYRPFASEITIITVLSPRKYEGETTKIVVFSPAK